MSSFSFIPEGHKMPSAKSRYTKVKEGETLKLRVLSLQITDGFVRWSIDNKPVRWRNGEDEPAGFDFKDEKARYFWALVVWNYETSQTEVWEITQKSILEDLRKYANDEDWGHPNTYDLRITRTGVGLETKYAMTALPHKKMSKEVEDAMNNSFPNVDALFTGDDPFEKAK
jgi:hypothetical protein